MFCEKCGRDGECIHKSNISNTEIYILIFFIVFISQGLSSLYLTEEGYTVVDIYFLGSFSLITINIVLFLAYFIFRKQYITLFYGCHQNVKRTFNFSGGPFVLCARCTGIFIGIILSMFMAIVPFNYYFLILFMIPLIIDGFIQLRTEYESHNIIRFITGFMFAPGFVLLYGLININVHRLFAMASEFIVGLFV